MTELPGTRPSILFICTANICRSPMAAGIFKKLLESREMNWREWKVESAGTWTTRGNPAAQKAIVVMADRGIDIRNHISRPITHLPLERYRLILTMEAGQKEAIRVEFPQVALRTYLLSEIIGETRDIADPIGGTIQDFVKTADDLEHVLDSGFSKICKLAAPEK